MLRLKVDHAPSFPRLHVAVSHAHHSGLGGQDIQVSAGSDSYRCRLGPHGRH